MSELHEAGDAVLAGDVLTTQAAARLLGVSVGTVLNMVERGELSAWRTAGGHRRVEREAVERFMRRQRQGQGAHPLRIMVIEDDDFLRAVYADQFASWKLPVDVKLYENGIEAMIDIGRQPPDVLVTDLCMPEVDGFSVARYLRSDERYKAISIVVISGLSDAEIAHEGGLPPGVALWHKPVPFPQLRGFVEALVNQRVREAGE
jgi:excisionase family DNA binding protein